jgi:hypothetical protein
LVVSWHPPNGENFRYRSIRWFVASAKKFHKGLNPPLPADRAGVGETRTRPAFLQDPAVVWRFQGTKVTGKSAQQVLRERIWQQLGMENNAYILLDERGTAKVSCGLACNPELAGSRAAHWIPNLMTTGL